jgi:hypothetical protein
MKLALTREQWREFDLLTLPWMYEFIFGSGREVEEYRHAHAAIALAGQPFGFTWEDVEFLRCEAMNNLDNGWRHDAAFCDSIADRIEALLPPREGR